MSKNKIKGIAKLNKAVSLEVAPFGISKAVCNSDEFFYQFSDESIGYKITVDDSDDLFDLFLKERFNYEVKYDFVLSLLHEIGHHKTEEDIDGCVYDFCISEKERIKAEIEEETRADVIKKLQFEYFNLPDEIMATQWAVKYAKEHPKKIKKMWKNIEKALFNFYNLNGLEPDEMADVI